MSVKLDSFDIGVYGMGVMGRNLALNLASRGFRVAVSNRSEKRYTEALEAAKAENVPLTGIFDKTEFVSALSAPRVIIIMVDAGLAVDSTIAALSPLLSPGDIIVDGGNEWYERTEARGAALAPAGVLYVGLGVSGGEEGARHGPALMPGGPPEAYARLEPMLMQIAAKAGKPIAGIHFPIAAGAAAGAWREEAGGEPCVALLGPGGAGNYVKMVHNGIEYGIMQAIAEAADVLRCLVGLTAFETADVFSKWNEGELRSFLVELTARVLRRRDAITGGPLVDVIADRAGMKGTGSQTVEDAAREGVAIPTISAALAARQMSGLRRVRERAQQLYADPAPPAPAPMGAGSGALASMPRAEAITAVGEALLCAILTCYAQGFALIRAKSEAKEWHVPLGRVAAIWRGGCIIRAGFLDTIAEALARDPSLDNLLLTPSMGAATQRTLPALRRICVATVQAGITAPAFTAALSYVDSLRRVRLPLALTQAQRDCFGAHGFERIDAEGKFHVAWEEPGDATGGDAERK